MGFRTGFYILKTECRGPRAALITISWAFMVPVVTMWWPGVESCFHGHCIFTELDWLGPLGPFLFQLEVLFRVRTLLWSAKPGFPRPGGWRSCELVAAETSPICLPEKSNMVLLGIGASDRDEGTPTALSVILPGMCLLLAIAHLFCEL